MEPLPNPANNAYPLHHHGRPPPAAHPPIPVSPVARSGPLSRTWPQLFKKRRRASPQRDDGISAQSRAENTLPPLKIPLPKTGAPNPTVSVLPDNASTSTGSTQAEMLASKSNYEWIAEGRHAEMGLHFSTAMATGVMMRRATHRAAEQARRDRMKSAMVELAEFLFDGEVTFGSGTSCFVVSREDKEANAQDEGTGEDGRKGKRGKNINKARIIEMALEKLRAQEQEIEMLKGREVEIEQLSSRLRACHCHEGTRAAISSSNAAEGSSDKMDMT